MHSRGRNEGEILRGNPGSGKLQELNKQVLTELPGSHDKDGNTQPSVFKTRKYIHGEALSRQPEGMLC